jgi:hypothetical protein
MAGTGRKPFETTDVVPFGAGNERLRPPPSLREPEKQAFLDLVTTRILSSSGHLTFHCSAAGPS